MRDTGAAAEIVRFKELRFHDTKEACVALKKALKGEFDHLAAPLQLDIQRFDERIFKSRMIRLLSALL